MNRLVFGCRAPAWSVRLLVAILCNPVVIREEGEGVSSLCEGMTDRNFSGIYLHVKSRFNVSIFFEAIPKYVSPTARTTLASNDTATSFFRSASLHTPSRNEGLVTKLSQ